MPPKRFHDLCLPSDDKQVKSVTHHRPENNSGNSGIVQK